MDEQRQTAGVVAPGRSLQRRRIDALRRAHRAREILDRERTIAARLGAVADARRDAGATGPGATGRPDGSRVDADHDPRAVDVDRLVEIHTALLRERRVARRPFNRHADRLVLALELAERLALQRLGYDDYADFEEHGGEPRPGRDVIDLDLVAWAERELVAAEAELRELDALEGIDRPQPTASLAPTWTLDAGLPGSTPGPRASRSRRHLFGAEIDGLGGSGRPGVTIEPGGGPLPRRPRPWGRDG